MGINRIPLLWWLGSITWDRNQSQWFSALSWRNAKGRERNLKGRTRARRADVCSYTLSNGPRASLIFLAYGKRESHGWTYFIRFRFSCWWNPHMRWSPCEYLMVDISILNDWTYRYVWHQISWFYFGWSLNLAGETSFVLWLNPGFCLVSLVNPFFPTLVKPWATNATCPRLKQRLFAPWLPSAVGRMLWMWQPEWRRRVSRLQTVLSSCRSYLRDLPWKIPS